jgi:hypothetical protein
MPKVPRVRRALLLFAVMAVSVGSGCGTYPQDCATDFANMMDVGVTVSKDPHFAFYMTFESTLPVGYADFDGTMIGWGGGRFGAMPHHMKAWGALAWGDEEVGWGNYDKDDPSTLHRMRVGLVGMPSGLITGYSDGYYVPS